MSTPTITVIITIILASYLRIPWLVLLGFIIVAFTPVIAAYNADRAMIPKYIKTRTQADKAKMNALVNWLTTLLFLGNNVVCYIAFCSMFPKEQVLINVLNAVIIGIDLICFVIALDFAINYEKRAHQLKLFVDEF